MDALYTGALPCACGATCLCALQVVARTECASRGNGPGLEVTVKLKDLLEAALRHNEESFAKEFPHPALVFDSRSPVTGEIVQVDTPSQGTMAFRRTQAAKTTDIALPGSTLGSVRAA